MPSTSSIIVAAAALFTVSAPIAAAKKDCREGTYYCGKDLLEIDRNYKSNIDRSLNAAGSEQCATTNRESWSLYYCRGNEDVPFVTYCGKDKCKDGGKDRNGRALNDFCDWPKA
ncbi:hypothetical protein MBLNU13_g00571t1 [Cladosporium sp. NU13]